MISRPRGACPPCLTAFYFSPNSPGKLAVDGSLDKWGEGGSLLSGNSERGNAGLLLHPPPNTEATGRQGHPIYDRILSHCLHLRASNCTPDLPGSPLWTAPSMFPTKPIAPPSYHPSPSLPPNLTSWSSRHPGHPLTKQPPSPKASLMTT